MKTEKKSGQPIPPKDEFDLVLNKTEAGQPPLSDPLCRFSYEWNFETGEGNAELVSINGVKASFPLYPIGLEGTLSFMSDMEPTPILIGEADIIIYRVMIDVNENTDQRNASIMFGDNGSSTLTNAL